MVEQEKNSSLELSRNEAVKRARTFAEQEFLCSEAVLMTVRDLLAIDSDMIPAIATGFGAGIGRHGSICGAISGGVMGLGLQFGRQHPSSNESTKSRRPYWFSTELISRFKETHKSIRCNELTGCNLSDSAGLKRYYDEKHWEITCRELIANVTGLVYDILAEEELSNAVDQ